MGKTEGLKLEKVLKIDYPIVFERNYLQKLQMKQHHCIHQKISECFLFSQMQRGQIDQPVWDTSYLEENAPKICRLPTWSNLNEKSKFGHRNRPQRHCGGESILQILSYKALIFLKYGKLFLVECVTKLCEDECVWEDLFYLKKKNKINKKWNSSIHF